MPTENRSSNTEMVSVPRQTLENVLRDGSCKREIHADFLRAQQSIRTLLDQPAPQPHPEPIAWMVGTAFWWTKEEAERDAAATGLPIVGLGPMTGTAPAEQHQGEPVAWRYRVHPGGYWFTTTKREQADLYRGTEDGGRVEPLYPRPVQGDAVAVVTIGHDDLAAIDLLVDSIEAGTKLYTRPAPGDTGEVERLQAEHGILAAANCNLKRERDTLRAQLAERDALPQFAQTVIRKLKRFRDCAEDGQGADIGKTWFDVLVQLGLLNRVQRSPAWWEITDEGEALLDGRVALSASAEPSAPAAQPGKCLDGGDCGIGGTCKWCPHITASPAQQPS